MWAKVCQEMGPGFKHPPVVMPSFLATAGAKPDLPLYRTFIPLLSIPFYLFPLRRRRLGKNRWMGNHHSGQADVRRAHFHNGRKVLSLRDTRHLLLHTQSTFLALSGPDARSHASLFAILLPWRRENHVPYTFIALFPERKLTFST